MKTAPDEVENVREQLHDLAELAKGAAKSKYLERYQLLAFIIATTHHFPAGFLNHFVNQLTELLFQQTQALCVQNSFALLEFVDAFSL